MEQKARVHSVETCGTVDGPGLRYVVFFQGCPMRCKYCHNPDTWKVNCGDEMTLSEILSDVLKYRSFMKFSDGGFTASGGEPLLQARFITELFKQLQIEGIHTALDTSGYANLNDVQELLSYTDLVLLDIKSMQPHKYRELTGVELSKTIKFAEYLDENQIPVWIRYVVIPELTDSADDVEALAIFLKTLSNVERVELLPFHKMGEEKWAKMNMIYALKDTPVPSEQVMERTKEIFEKHKLPI